MIQVKEVRGGYGNKKVIDGVSFEIKQGEFVGILGPNGSGKTTLLKMIAGIMPPESGQVCLDKQPIQSYGAKALAQKLAVLPQKTEQAFSFTVEETVQFGRYPYQKGWLQSITKEDMDIVHQVMEQTDIIQFKDQSIHELSGGEQQRVYLAQALAQQPEYLLLDEPTSFLDLAYQKHLLDLIKQETYSSKLAVIGVFHDVNIASLYCDRLLLLHEGKTEMLGSPERVLTTDRIHRVYETNVTSLQHPFRANPQFIIEPAVSSIELDQQALSIAWKMNGQDGMTLCMNQPLRILSSHSDNGGFYWKRSLGTGSMALRTTSEQTDGHEDMLFMFQSDSPKQYATEEDDHFALYGMCSEEELTVWLVMKRSLSDGTMIQLMGQLMYFIQLQTNMTIQHLCVISTKEKESGHGALWEKHLQQKIRQLLATLDVIKK
ncbi:heme ABC transporter ATP-binding protein [Bacillus sp. 179-C3.3 HS]|uniref:heme ABC transporter ATP-binding protein n=1 Tax=Bacillus sp. 179-C3.3 HS TaxID=3232162 RepID=UPI0039A231D2